MERLVIISEDELTQLLERVVQKCLTQSLRSSAAGATKEEKLRSRKEMASELNISLTTLDTWKKNGLPFHKQGGRTYYVKSEVVAYIRELAKKKSPQLLRSGAELRLI